MIHKLLVVFDAAIISECWTYYKLAIIQTSPYHQSWLASHMNIYMNENLEAFFGEDFQVYPLRYYNEILDAQEISLSKVNEQHIIETIVEQLEKGYYIIIDCDFSRLFHRANSEISIHETIIFGCDTEAKVFYVAVTNETGNFGETSVSFLSLAESYTSVRQHYILNPDKMIERRRFFYNITRIGVRTDYCTDNDMYLMLQKIRGEVYGRTIKNLLYSDDETLILESKHYIGSGCLIGIRDGIEKMIMENKFLMQYITLDRARAITHSLKKLHEHRVIILSSMHWLIEKLKMEDPQVCKAIETYANCCERMHMIYLMAYKFEITKDINDISILERILEQLKNQYQTETQALLKFMNLSQAFYEKAQHI